MGRLASFCKRLRLVNLFVFADLFRPSITLIVTHIDESPTNTDSLIKVYSMVILQVRSLTHESVPL